MRYIRIAKRQPYTEKTKAEKVYVTLKLEKFTDKPRLHAFIYTRCANFTYVYNLHPGVFLGMWTQLHICKS